MMPLDLLVSHKENALEYLRAESYADDIYAKLQHAFQVAQMHSCGEQKRQKRIYDSKLKGEPYHAGQKVWLFHPLKRVGLSPKFQSFWKGPYVVIKRISDAVYRIKDVKTQYRTVVHFDRLKPCYSQDDVDSFQPEFAENAGDSGGAGQGMPNDQRIPWGTANSTPAEESSGPQPDADAGEATEGQSLDETGSYSDQENMTRDVPQPYHPPLVFPPGFDRYASDSPESERTGHPHHPRRRRQLPPWLRTGDFVT